MQISFVIYKVFKADGSVIDVDNPSNLPPVGEIEHMEEPFVKASIHTPQEYVGALMETCQNKRGVFKDMVYEGSRVCLHYEMPLSEIIFDFFDQIKSRSRGYASFDYEIKGYVEDISGYETIFVCYPCWCGTAPMCIFTFLEHYDWTGKKIIPVCTNEGSGMGSSERHIKRLAPGATVAKGISVTGSNAANAGAQVKKWLAANGLI